MDCTPELEVFRDQIDKLDKKIILLIAKRINVCRAVAQYKKQANICMMQPNRIKQVIQKAVDTGKKLHLSEALMSRVYQEIINEACRVEDDIIEG